MNVYLLDKATNTPTTLLGKVIEVSSTMDKVIFDDENRGRGVTSGIDTGSVEIFVTDQPIDLFQTLPKGLVNKVGNFFAVTDGDMTNMLMQELVDLKFEVLTLKGLA